MRYKCLVLDHDDTVVNSTATNMISAIPTTVAIMVMMFLPIWKSWVTIVPKNRSKKNHTQARPIVKVTNPDSDRDTTWVSAVEQITRKGMGARA